MRRGRAPSGLRFPAARIVCKSPAMDAVALAQALIRCPSVTPKDEGALGVLEAALAPLGFACHRLRFEGDGTAPVDNLYARIGSAAPHFCFAGHTDVVPPGDSSLWRHDPFGAEIADGTLYGRGAADMKSAIAAFVQAAARHLAKGALNGSISLLITGDEEGVAINGTAKVLDWLKARGETLDHCVVGEPTSTAAAGDTIKIGRRGSLTARIRVRGTQGHVGYPHKAKNPIPAMAKLIGALSGKAIDPGTDHFEPSTLSFTTVDVGNPAGNVIPAEARAQLNIRFNDRQSHDALEDWIRGEADAVAARSGCEIAIAFERGGQVFLTKPGPFVNLLADATENVTGARPALSTTGGTSDARFIKSHCPVAELGLPGGTMHKADECVPVAEIQRLSAIYAELLQRYFAAPP
ncbi:MAG: succinyl-diaminopimelate desuccinylase [Alphaproteobacteria bacterium]|nr:succinyl-diaminopimelate desuccinylase [Alphaproteobacteria bacterium]MBV9695042.1 succinyl-diaminopimelate desuccinylase [Alphaproteobacteria bacterium]